MEVNPIWEIFWRSSQFPKWTFGSRIEKKVNTTFTNTIESEVWKQKHLKVFKLINSLREGVSWTQEFKQWSRRTEAFKTAEMLRRNWWWLETAARKAGREYRDCFLWSHMKEDCFPCQKNRVSHVGNNYWPMPHPPRGAERVCDR